MTAFVVWVPRSAAELPSRNAAVGILDPSRLAYDSKVERGTLARFGWAVAHRADTPEFGPAIAADASRGLALALFGPVFAIDGQPCGTLPQDEVARRVLDIAASDPSGWQTRLRGHMAAFLSDERTASVQAVRDPMGAQPLYWRQGREGIALANAGRLLLDLDGQRVGPDRAQLSTFLVEDIVGSSASGSEATYIEGVRRVLHGHALTVTATGVRLDRYFDVASLFLETKMVDPDPERYRELLASVISDQAGDMDRTGVTLSGGLDSPAIALLLARLLGRDTPLRTVSLGNLGQGADESENVRSVLNDIRAEPVWVVPDDSRIFDTLTTAHQQLEAPMFSPSPAVFMLLKQAAADAGLRRIFGGLGADEALGGLNLGFLKDLLRTGQLIRFWSELKAVRDVDAMRQNLSRTSLVREHVYDPLVRFRGRPAAPAWVRKDVTAEFNLLGGRAPRPEVDGIGSFDGRVAAILGRTFTQSFLHYESHYAVAWGVENRFPYIDPKLLAYAARLPWHERFSAGTYKHHHRKAFAGMFPEKIGMQRKKSLIPAVHDHWLRSIARTPVRDIIEGGGAWTDFLDADVVRTEYRAYMDAQDEPVRNRLRRSTWRAVTVELFLQSLNTRAHALQHAKLAS